MTHISKEGKPIRMPKQMPKLKSRNYENMEKILRNEMDYYKDHWPFESPKTRWQTFLSMFWTFRVVRKFIGGTWIKGDHFGLWLKVNKNFERSWLDGYDHEIWDPKP